MSNVVTTTEGDQDAMPYTYLVGPHAASAATVDLMDQFTLRAPDASGGQVREGVSYEDVDPTRLFPVAGPVSVRGIAVGDKVGIGVVDIRCASHGHVWTRPGLGLGNPGWFAVRRLSINPPEVRDATGLTVPYAPHVGTLGVVPHNAHPARTLGQYGGNLDIPELGPGAMLWVTSTFEGGGVFAGDVHAAIGDAEVCGTGVEAAAEIDLAVVRADFTWPSANPAVVTAERTWLLGIGPSFEAALNDVLPTVTRAVAERFATNDEQAFLLASVLLDVRTCQIVNPLTSVAVSLRHGLDRCLVPEGAHAAFSKFIDTYVKEGKQLNAHR